MIRLISLLILSTSFFINEINAADYRVTLLRAAPGYLGPLLEETKTLRKQKNGELIIMRHSQGDHWDIMLLAPQGENILEEYEFKSLVAFQHTFLAKAPEDWAKIAKRDKRSGLYHIEIFKAVPGKYDELLKQRYMENAYYNATEREGNIVFETTFGNDMDMFTLGFYKDMVTFATDPDLPNDVFEKAATDAGFESRSSIGLYLRGLIATHNDTLATKVN